jgi:hypothetical protein
LRLQAIIIQRLAQSLWLGHSAALDF